MNAPLARKWISVFETSELLGLSVSGIRKLISRGEIPCVRLGRTLRIPLHKLEGQLEAQLKGSSR
ncbi:MAG: helix-turn-helix domain-containing protein [Acidobacteria bacterium]|nr:helix-turn-helix domain-containing protein [Acidobacteriota bacterium]